MSEREISDTVHGSEEQVDKLGTDFTDALGVSWFWWLGGFIMLACIWIEQTYQISPSFVAEVVFGTAALLLLAGAAIKFFGRWHAVDFIRL